MPDFAALVAPRAAAPPAAATAAPAGGLVGALPGEVPGFPAGSARERFGREGRGKGKGSLRDSARHLLSEERAHGLQRAGLRLETPGSSELAGVGCVTARTLPGRRPWEVAPTGGRRREVAAARRAGAAVSAAGRAGGPAAVWRPAAPGPVPAREAAVM